LASEIGVTTIHTNGIENPPTNVWAFTPALTTITLVWTVPVPTTTAGAGAEDELRVMKWTNTNNAAGKVTVALGNNGNTCKAAANSTPLVDVTVMGA